VTSTPAVDADAEEPSDRRLIWLIGGIVVGALWIRPLTSSLWWDEFGTWWTVKDGLPQAADRAWTYQGQSPLYYLLVWLTRHVLGHAEWALRAPSLVCAAISAYLLYLLVRRLVDDVCARLSVLVFVAWPIVAFSAIDARPYALATLFTIAATLALVRWIDRGDAWLGVATVLLVGGAAGAHYLFGLVLIPLVVYATIRVREGSAAVRTRDFLLALIGLVIVLVPIARGFADLWSRRSSIALPDGLSVDWIVTLTLPAAMIGGVVLGAALASRDGGRLTTRLRISPADLALVVSWTAGPALALVVASMISPLGLQGRYSLVWAPGAVILVSLAIRAFAPASARRIIALTIAVLSVLALGATDHLGDWRGAMALIGGDATERSVVLVQSGYIESLHLDWYADPERVSYLGASTSYYPVPGDAVVLPVDVSPVQDFSRDRIEGAIGDADRVFLVTSTAWMATWVGEVLHDHGFEQRQLSAGTPLAYEYVRA
jgi:4-amino-4-deoxy-L-arabinose transferase-like glycosyltransferase